MAKKRFDVFLSYNSQDRDDVEKIAVYLADRAGLEPWFDMWSQVTGEPFVDNIYHGLASTNCCAVCVGRGGTGPWQTKEVYAALQRHSTREGFRIIPVLLPGVSTVPDLDRFLSEFAPFLSQYGRVQFDKGLDDDSALWRLECGIRGQPSGRGRPSSTIVNPPKEPKPSAASSLPNPNIDLMYGPLESGSRYYIRRAADMDVFNAVQRPRGMVLVRGPKGTGKSSIINQLYASRERGYSDIQILYISFLGLKAEAFSSLPALWSAILAKSSRQLNLEEPPGSHSSLEDNLDASILSFFDRCLTASKNTPLLICFDEVDRDFDRSLDPEVRSRYFNVRTQFFTNVRALYSDGVSDETLRKVRWLLAYSSEPKFFVPKVDIVGSPFNVGHPVRLGTFNDKEVKELARRYGLEPDQPFVDQIMDYVWGRPYLVALLFYHWVCHEDSRETLFDGQSAGGGIFLDHLRRYDEQFQKDAELSGAMRGIVDGRSCKDAALVERLEAAGLIRKLANRQVVPLCRLYADYYASYFKSFKVVG
jgi:hypothetical protein